MCLIPEHPCVDCGVILTNKAQRCLVCNKKHLKQYKAQYFQKTKGKYYSKHNAVRRMSQKEFLENVRKLFRVESEA